MKIIHPENWKPPKGYSHGMLAEGKLLFISGQIGWNAACELASNELVPQVKQALENVVAVVREAGGAADDVARMTWYVKDKKEYLSHAKEIGEVYRVLFGKHYPAMTLVEVSDLLEQCALVEIEATAILS